MTWERGFVVCHDKVADAIGSQLEAQSVSIRLISRDGETAFAFAGRAIPSFDTGSYFVCSVDGRNSGYSHSRLNAYRPSQLVPKLGLTFGIALGRNFLDLHRELPDLAGPWRALGPESQREAADGVVTFRWDLDGCEIDAPQIRTHTESLKAIHQLLEERSIPYRVVVFDDGWPEVLGDLPEGGEVFAGPATFLALRWESKEGDPSSVVANDAEFMVDGDDIPESELWAL